MVRNKMKRVPIGCDSPVPAPCFISQSQLSLWLCYGPPVLNRRLLLWCMSYNLKFSDAGFYFKPACEQNITDHSYNNYILVSPIPQARKYSHFSSTNREESENSSNCPIGMNRLVWIACFCLLQLLSSTELCLRCLIQHQTHLLTTGTHGKLEGLCLCLELQ